MFTKKTLSFLRALKRNNDREWFRAHRDEYERQVRQPMIAVVERLAIDFRGIAPELVAAPAVSLFRPWRDTRFSENKTPLKTNIAAVCPHRALGRMNGASLYFEVATDWVWIGGGVYSPDGPQLHALREHIAEHQKRFERIIGAPAFRRLGGLKGDTLSRIPRGFRKDHPAARYLVHKQFMGVREEPARFAAEPGFYSQLVATFRAMAPLVRFLNEPLVERLKMERRAHILYE